MSLYTTSLSRHDSEENSFHRNDIEQRAANWLAFPAKLPTPISPGR